MDSSFYIITDENYCQVEVLYYPLVLLKIVQVAIGEVLELKKKKIESRLFYEYENGIIDALKHRITVPSLRRPVTMRSRTY